MAGRGQGYYPPESSTLSTDNTIDSKEWIFTMERILPGDSFQFSWRFTSLWSEQDLNTTSSPVTRNLGFYQFPRIYLTIVTRWIRWFRRPLAGSANHSLVPPTTRWFRRPLAGSANHSLVLPTTRWFRRPLAGSANRSLVTLTARWFRGPLAGSADR